MIRISILADTYSRAARLASDLKVNPSLQVVDVRAFPDTRAPALSGAVDVLIADRLHPDDLPMDGPALVLISDQTQPEAALPPGVRACLPSDVSADELQAAVLAAAHDFTVLTAGQARRLQRHLSPANQIHQPDELKEDLTPRELQVLRLLAEGLGNKEIASRLHISGHTSKFHVAQILAKFRAGSRAEAVAVGIRRGLVPI